MVEVRGQHHVFEGLLRVAARQAADHVDAVDRLLARLSGHAHAPGQLEADQFAALQPREDLLGRHRRAGKQPLGHMRAHGRGGSQLGEAVDGLAVRPAQAHGGHQPVARTARPGRLGFAFGIAERDHPDRAALDKARVLDQARAVVRALVVREALGRAAQHHHDLPAHVEPTEIVVLELRRGHALTDEDQRRFQRMGVGVEVHAGQEIGLELEALAAAGVVADALQHQLGRARHALRLDQRHALEIAALVAARLKPEAAVLGGDVVRGDVIAASAGGTAFQQIVGQEAQVGLDAPGGAGLIERRRRDALPLQRAAGQPQRECSSEGERAGVARHAGLQT